jgi:pimeloyl-ACP methyl ester carboxylesterase
VAITDIKGTLKRIEAPTMLLYGQFDKAYVKFSADAKAALKTSQIAFVPNSGAFVMQDNPPATAEILGRFVNEG